MSTTPTTSYDLWRDWGGEGPALHFAHANGFPPGTYRRLMGELTRRFRVLTTESRPLWPASSHAELKGWPELADDLRQRLGERDLRNVVGVGHSLGAAMTLLAAARDPGLFAAVIAIDPLMLTGWRATGWAAMKALGLGARLGLVRGALQRRERWPTRELARRAYRGKAIFRDWQDDVLDDYVEDGLIEDAQGYRLRYPREWEARIFEVSPHDLWSPLRTLTTPTLFIQGALSDTFQDAARLRVRRTLPCARTVVIADSSHFVPMERPEKVAHEITAFVDGLAGSRGCVCDESVRFRRGTPR